MLTSGTYSALRQAREDPGKDRGALRWKKQLTTRGRKDPCSPDLAREPACAPTSRGMFSAERAAGTRAALGLSLRHACSVGVASGLRAGSRKLSASHSRRAAAVREAGGGRGARAPHVSDWGPRPGGGGRSVTVSPPCSTVTSSRSLSPAATATSSCLSADPFFEPLEFCRLKAPQAAPPGSTPLRHVRYFPWFSRGEQAGSPRLELVSRRHRCVQNMRGASEV